MIDNNFNKIALFVEDFLPTKSRKVLRTVLDFIRPHVLAIGLRVTRLKQSEIEILIPFKRRNLNPDKSYLESILLTAGIEAVQRLWLFNAPEGHFQVNIRKIEFKSLQKNTGEVRVRVHLRELSREVTMAELIERKKVIETNHVQFFDEKDQLVAEAEIQVELLIKELIGWN